MTPRGKKILVFSAVVLIVIFFVSILILKSSSVVASTNQASINRALDGLEEPFKKDTIGGDTPEATVTQFITTVESEDLKNASRFYDVNHQDQAYKRLLKLQSENKLEFWLQNVKTLEKDRVQHGGRLVYYSYKYFDQPTNQYLWAPLVFYKNPFTQVWKIVY